VNTRAYRRPRAARRRADKEVALLSCPLRPCGAARCTPLMRTARRLELLVYGSGAALAQSSMCSALIGPAQHHIEARGRGLWLGLAHSGSLRAQGSVRRRRQNGLRQLRQAWRSPAQHAQLPHLLQAEQGSRELWMFGRPAAQYIDRILQGEHPADLPVQEVSQIGLIVSRTTANRLGLSIPTSLLVFPDEVTE
jgi:hypothetical protein